MSDPHQIEGAAVALSPPVGHLPDWIHLLPAGPDILTFDERGPYRVEDLHAIVEASASERTNGALPIDESHATDLGAASGASAHAVGWIEEMAVRDNGIWGRVRWTEAGANLIESLAYRGVSPVLQVDPKTGVVQRILRAALTNVPNLRGLAALNAEAEHPPTLRDRIVVALGVPADATDDHLLAEVAAGLAARSARADGRGAMAAIAQVLCGEQADDATVLAKAWHAAAALAEVGRLRDTVARVEHEQRVAEATAWIDAAIASGRCVPAPQRTELISIRLVNPDSAEVLLAGFPNLAAPRPAVRLGAQQTTTLSEGQKHVAKMLGLTEEAYRKTLEHEQTLRRAREKLEERSG